MKVCLSAFFHGHRYRERCDTRNGCFIALFYFHICGEGYDTRKVYLSAIFHGHRCREGCDARMVVSQTIFIDTYAGNYVIPAVCLGIDQHPEQHSVYIQFIWHSGEELTVGLHMHKILIRSRVVIW